jgi:hypothetical protein
MQPEQKEKAEPVGHFGVDAMCIQFPADSGMKIVLGARLAESLGNWYTANDFRVWITYHRKTEHIALHSQSLPLETQ